MRRKQDRRQTNRNYVTESDVLIKHHKFIRQSESDSESSSSKQRQRSGRKSKKDHNQRYGETMAKKYYSKLYKEYALVDLSRFETGQIGCRWRTEKEVVAEKGEAICGATTCDLRAKHTFEINFGYLEDGKKKNALVKVSLCPECEKKLNHKKTHQKVHVQSVVHNEEK